MSQSKKQSPMPKLSRRSFLKQSAALGSVAVLPNIITGCATSSGARRPLPSERVTMGVIGFGWQGFGNTQSFINIDDVQVVAVCDVDEEHRMLGKDFVDQHYDNTDCAAFHNFEEICAREDIDTMLISLPDHWHAIPAIAAANAGKHIWGEKPLSHSLVEGRAMADAVKKNGVIWQMGSWQRSVSNFHKCAELVANGAVGKVHTIECGLTVGHEDYEGTAAQKSWRPAPAHLDYDRWLGPSGPPSQFPYAPARVHKNWRWVMAHGGGALMDWVGHHVDIAHWGMGLDDTGPVEVKGTGVIPPKGVLWDSPTEYDCYATYRDGLVIHMSSDFPTGTKWIGDAGWIYVDRGDTMESDIAGVFEEDRSNLKKKLYKSDDHWQNFIDCVRSGNETITPCETGHRSASVGHLCNIAMYTGRTIKWNPKTEKIADDSEASAMLSPDYYDDWEL